MFKIEKGRGPTEKEIVVDIGLHRLKTGKENAKPKGIEKEGVNRIDK
jgi:hypothetical protein